MSAISNQGTSEPGSLASEMVKLLNEELRRVCMEIQELELGRQKRARDSSVTTSSDSEVYLLQEENVQLRHEIECMKAELSSLQQTSGGQDYSSRLEALEAERRSRDGAFADARASLATELSVKRDKHKRVQSKNVALKESSEQLRKNVEEARREIRDAERQLTVLSERVKAERSFSPLVFPRASPKGALGMPAKHIVAFRANSPLRLPEPARQLCIQNKYMSKVPQGVVWPDDGRTTHCLVISPTFFYHAKAGNASRGAWKKTPDAERKYGEEIELFYRESNLWRYLGTYRCIGNAPSALPKIRKLGPQYASNVIKETIQDRKAIPPVVANTIEQMYDMAVLQAVCSGWLRIGYNRDLAGALPSRVDCSASSSKQAQGPPNSIVPKKRAIGEEFGGGRRKRSKAR